MKPQILKAIKDAGGEITLEELRRQIIGSVENFSLRLFHRSLSEIRADGMIAHRYNGSDLIYFITPAGREVEL